MEQTQEIQTNTWQKRLGGFFEKNGALFFAPVIVLCIYVIALVCYGVWPFGKEYTLSSYDLSAQIAPFIEHIFDVFEGKSTLTYSYAIAGGADVTGTFLYFFISPFSFVFLLFGDGMVAHASSIVMGLKLAAIAVAGTWFAKKLFKGIPDYLCTAVGVVYVYCGYAFVSCTYINWMDFLIYLPFCTGAFVHFVKTDRFLPFSILVACCVYTCFSIACFSMLTAFPVLIAYGLLCVEKQKRNKFLASVCLAFVVAILLALPVLLPALISYLKSGRSGEGLFFNFWFGFMRDADTGALTFIDKTFLECWSESLYKKWSYILSDSIFLILTIVWFYRRKLQGSFCTFMLVAGALTIIPVVVDEAMLLLNMGSYMSYALRFGFLNALYLLGGACLALENVCYDKNRAYDGAPLYDKKEEINGTKEENDGGRYETKNKKRIPTYAMITIALGALVTGFLLWFISGNHYKNIWNFTTDNENILNNFQSVSSRYAHSLGGLEVIAVLFVAVVIVASVGCIFVAKKKLSARLLSFVLLTVVCVQTLFYNNQIVLGNRSTQHTDFAAYQNLCQTLSEREDGYFRVKDYGDKFTANAPFTGESNSFSVFSSVIDRDNFTVLELFGYEGNGTNSLKSAHNEDKGNRCEEFGDSFLGYKYFLVPAAKKDEVMTDSTYRKYIKPVMTLDENGDEVQLKDGGFYVYENEIVFPSAYRVSSGSFRFTYPNTANSSYRKYNQQALYKYLRGKTLTEMKEETGSRSAEFVTPETARELSDYLQSKSAEIVVEAGTITAKTTAEEGEYLFLNFVASTGYEVRVNGKKATLEDNDLHFLCVKLEAGENEVVFTYRSPYISYALMGAAGTIVGLLALALVVKKTRIWQNLSPVIAWTGIALAGGVVAFFFLFPTITWLVKLVYLLL